MKLTLPCTFLATFTALWSTSASSDVTASEERDLLGYTYGNSLIPQCSADCNYDEDCSPGLSCWYREPIGSPEFQHFNYPTDQIPGCPNVKPVNPRADYCINPHDFPPDTLFFAGEAEYKHPVFVYPLKHCWGDCHTDYDCDKGLICLLRGKNSPSSVPGCQGVAQLDVGYCVKPPTMHPSPYPTPGPTKSPTLFPTKRPTPQPTKRPTPRPTPMPSPHPTPGPTKSPTMFPTKRPTPQPTPSPTSYPTVYPTKRPTPRPTPVPTKSPTARPTPHPTYAPVPPPTPFPTMPPTLPQLTFVGACQFAAGGKGKGKGASMSVSGSFPQACGLFPLYECEGHCSSTADCVPPLVCFQPLPGGPVPGCVGKPHPSVQYCVDPSLLKKPVGPPVGY